MKDSSGTNKELLEEIFILKQRIQELEQSETEHRHTAEALRGSEMKFRTLYDSNSDAVMLLDKTGFLDCNKATLAIFGCASREEFCSIHPADLSPSLQPCGSDSKVLSNRHIDTAFEKGRHRFEWVHKKADTGKSFLSDVLLTSMVLDDKPVLLSVVRNITEQKQAEEAIKKYSYDLKERVKELNCLYSISEIVRRQDISMEIILQECASVISQAFQFPEVTACRITWDDHNYVAGNFIETPWLRNHAIMVNGRQAGTIEICYLEKRPEEYDGPFLAEEIQLLNSVSDLLGKATERKQAENALREKEDFLNTLLNAIPIPVYYKDKDGQYLGFNESFESFFGAAREQLIGKTAFDINPAELAEVYHAKDIELLNSGGLQQYESQLRNALGILRNVIFTKSVFTDSRGVISGMIGVILDITKRKQAEEALKKSEEKYRNIFENSMEGIYRTTPEGRFIDANPALARLFGYKSPEALINAVTDIGYQIYAERGERDKAMKLLMEQGFIDNFEMHYCRKDGSIGWGLLNSRIVRDDQGNILYIEGTCQDITKRRRAEMALKQSEGRLSSIIEFLPDATFVIDLEGRIISWNRAIEEMTGFSAETMLGKGKYEYAIPFYETRRAILVDMLFNRDDDIEKQYSFIKKDGDTLYAETDIPNMGGYKRTLWVKASPIRNERGDVIGAIESIRDITERKHMEEALKKAKDYAENLIKTSNILIVGLDADGKITLLNEEGEKITGYNADEVAGKDWFQLMIPERIRSYVCDGFNKLKNVNAGMGTFENPILTKSGEERIISWKNSALIQDGRFIGTISFGMDITDRKKTEAEREKLILELREALDKVKTLSGLLPICSSCKKIRNDKGYWEQIEVYIQNHSEADFTHSICPECKEKLYPELYKKK